MSAKLVLDVITQEKRLFTKTVDAVIAPAVLGEVTILPGHIPLFTRLNDGLLRYRLGNADEALAVLGGFMDVGPGNRVTVLADTASLSNEVSEAQALAAKAQAEAALKNKTSDLEFKQAEVALRKSLLDLQLSRRRRANT